jgi:hypothetical protein
VLSFVVKLLTFGAEGLAPWLGWPQILGFSDKDWSNSVNVGRKLPTDCEEKISPCALIA